MTVFQAQTFIPRDGNLSITLPESFREVDVSLFISKNEKTPSGKKRQEEHIAWMKKFRGSLQSIDYSDIREEIERPHKMSKEERLAWINSFRGTLRDIDYSDLRDETEREL